VGGLRIKVGGSRNSGAELDTDREWQSGRLGHREALVTHQLD